MPTSALRPADDGGFYAISARRTHPGMFDLVAWSQPSTMAADDCRLLRVVDFTVEVGSALVRLDGPSDLDRLRRFRIFRLKQPRLLDRLTAAQPGIG